MPHWRPTEHAVGADVGAFDLHPFAFIYKSGAGEAIRTPDPNLGNVRSNGRLLPAVVARAI
jgi:hypothetical protein